MSIADLEKGNALARIRGVETAMNSRGKGSVVEIRHTGRTGVVQKYLSCPGTYWFPV